jgi:hypothetical protein
MHSLLSNNNSMGSTFNLNGFQFILRGSSLVNNGILTGLTGEVVCTSLEVQQHNLTVGPEFVQKDL